MEYFEREDLVAFGKGELGEFDKELWDKFMSWYGDVFSEGALTVREKALIALAVAHAVHCPYCIEAYTDATMSAGCSHEEMMEAVHVAAAITGGATLAFGTQMKKLVDQVEF
ncbi:MAG: arsenosugar biosynthesis-associated peroxidase-like protein [Ezakiella sp.]|nr:arsenosugar biosynthesis-associated peroxidase-like protein [Ezakiella sp.]